MRVRFGDRVLTGSVIDLRGCGVGGEVVWSAVCDGGDERVECVVPQAVTRRVGVVSRGVSVVVRTGVVAAVRSWGVETPFDRELAACQRLVRALEVPAVDVGGARAAVAALGEEEAALRERVARLGGRVSVYREIDAGDVESASARLEEAVAELSEVETERVAAEQRLERVRREARGVRDVLDRRRGLRDRIDNLRRSAREWVVDRYYHRFQEAVARVPGMADPGEGPSDFSGPEWVGALAVLRLADRVGPAVIAGGVGGDSAVAAVGEPVVRVEV